MLVNAKKNQRPLKQNKSLILLQSLYEFLTQTKVRGNATVILVARFTVAVGARGHKAGPRRDVGGGPAGN